MLLSKTSSQKPPSPSVNKSGSSRLNYVLPLRIGNWIEDTPFVIPPEMETWFGPPRGDPNDPYFPVINLLCGESVVTDSAKDGGDLGYRIFQDLMSPTDRLKVQLKLLLPNISMICIRYVTLMIFPLFLFYSARLLIICLTLFFRHFSLAKIYTMYTGGRR